jgi:acetyltransferase-like isoleucine patch superfamily enzyme
MKKVFLFLLDILTFPLALLHNAAISGKCSLLADKIYTFIVRRGFAAAPKSTLLRRPLYITGARHIELGENVIIAKHVRMDAITFYEKSSQTFNPRIIVGNNVAINMQCHIGCINRVQIGNYVTIAARTLIIDHTHGTSAAEELKLPPRHRKLYSRGPVVIGDYATLGEGCAVMPGVTIGHNAVIGANSVVTKDIPPYCVAAGNPAKVIKCFSDNNN